MTVPVQFLTYQHNVQKYFLGHGDKYGGVIIPLSIATAFPSGTYGFIRALCARDKTKKYAIDPRNALFQKNWNRDTNLRDPHKRMAAVLDEPFKSGGVARPLSPVDFADDDTLKNSVKCCLEFQKQFRASADDERKLKKYMKLLGLTSLSPLGPPQFLVPPYFQFETVGDDWCDVSRRCVVASLQFRDSLPVEPVLHFGRWASVTDWRPWFAVFRESAIDSFWLYPNNFREHDATLAELRGYRNSVEAAVTAQLHPSSLFAGYYGILLSYFGLERFGNGVGYGEWRDSGYHKGGTAATRVYMPKLHQFLDAPVAQTIIDIDKDYFGSGTDVLEACVSTDRPLSSLSLEECLDHFMECRANEIEFVRNNALSHAVEELQATIEKLQAHKLEREKFGVPLERWISALG